MWSCHMAPGVGVRVAVREEHDVVRVAAPQGEGQRMVVPVAAAPAVHQDVVLKIAHGLPHPQPALARLLLRLWPTAA